MKPSRRPDREHQGSEFDAVSFWLLLLFIATFFGIAAEQSRNARHAKQVETTAAVRAFPLTNPATSSSEDRR